VRGTFRFLEGLFHGQKALSKPLKDAFYAPSYHEIKQLRPSDQGKKSDEQKNRFITNSLCVTITYSSSFQRA
jgi:hypothetical protein